MRNPAAAVSDPAFFHTHPGDPVHVNYRAVVGERGQYRLEVSGKDNTDDLIQSYESSTDLSLIVSRFLNGDASALAVHTPIFGDFSTLIESPGQMLDFVRRARSDFAQLPLQLRQSFDNDFDQWFSTYGSEDWFKKMSHEVTPDAE